MSTSTKTTKISAVFLAAILVAGTIALSSPSFMTGAQAEPYGMDKSYEKSYDKKSNGKNVSVKSIKCNNINVNVNGLELSGLPPFLGGLAGDGDSDGGANSYGNGGSYGRDGGSYGDGGYGKDGDFKFICINNNNNTVIGEDNDTVVPPPPPPPPVIGCEECFDNLTVDLQVLLGEALEEGFELGPLNVTAGSTIEDLCDQLEALPFPLEIPGFAILVFIINNLEDFATVEDIASFLNLLVCLEDLGLIDVDIFGFISLAIEEGLLPAGTTADLLGITP